MLKQMYRHQHKNSRHSLKIKRGGDTRALNQPVNRASETYPSPTTETQSDGTAATQETPAAPVSSASTDEQDSSAVTPEATDNPSAPVQEDSQLTDPSAGTDATTVNETDPSTEDPAVTDNSAEQGTSGAGTTSGTTDAEENTVSSVENNDVSGTTDKDNSTSESDNVTDGNASAVADENLNKFISEENNDTEENDIETNVDSSYIPKNAKSNALFKRAPEVQTWIKTGKTTTVQSSGDKERAILTNNEGKKDSHGDVIRVLSTGSTKNSQTPTVETILGVNIDGGEYKTIFSLTNNICEYAWISPQNFLLYTEDDPKGNYKAGDRIIYNSTDGKKYYLYFTDGKHDGYYDTALVIPEESTVNNIDEGLEIDMVDWGGSKNTNGESKPDEYIKQSQNGDYVKGIQKQLTYNGKEDNPQEVSLTTGSGISSSIINGVNTGIYVDNETSRYILLPDVTDPVNINDQNVPLFYYFNRNSRDSILVFQEKSQRSYECLGYKDHKEIEDNYNDSKEKNVKPWIIGVTNSSKTSHGYTNNEPVQYVTFENAVFNKELKDNYPTISKDYDKKNPTEGGTSLKELFDYNWINTKQPGFNEDNVKDEIAAHPHFGVNSTSSYDSYFRTNGLLQLTEDGYWYYDSDKNFATLVPNGYGVYDKQNNAGKYETSAVNNSTVAFVLFKETGVVDKTSDKADWHNGAFMPYDTLNLAVPDSTSTSVNYSTNKFEITRPGNPDYLFGMQASGKFVQTPGGKINGKPMIFEFSGDDDMVVYIDGKLALDLSGIHGALSGKIDFANGTVTSQVNIQNAIGNLRYSDVIKQRDDISTTTSFKDIFGAENVNDEGTFDDGTLHSIRIFYMERGRGSSNLYMKMNLQTAPVNTVTSSVKKTWNDGGKNHDSDPITMTFQYSLDGGKTYTDYDLDPSTEAIDGAVLNNANDWSASVRRLPHYVKVDENNPFKEGETKYSYDQSTGEYHVDLENGEYREIKYQWVEKDIPTGYQASTEVKDDHDKEERGIFSQMFNIINTLLAKTSVKQTWNDGNNKFKKRPDNVTMTFQYSTDGGKTYTDYDFDPSTKDIDGAVLNNANNWSASVNLPKYDENGKEIKYIYRWVDGNNKTGYRSASSIQSDDGALNQVYTIANTLQATSSVTKSWDDENDKDKVRPESINLTLHRVNADGTITDLKTVAVTAKDNWTATSDPVDRFDENGKELRYYWTEGDIPAYKQSEYVQYALGDTQVNERTKITNKHTSVTSVNPVTQTGDNTAQVSQQTTGSTGNTVVITTKINQNQNSDPTGNAVQQETVTEDTSVTAEKKENTPGPKQADERKPGVVNTGDSGDVNGYGVMTVFAAIAAIWALITRKRRFSE